VIVINGPEKRRKGLVARLYGIADLSSDLYTSLLLATGEHPFDPIVFEANHDALLGWQAQAIGVVYFLLSHDTGNIKIGFTRGVMQRIAELKTATARGITCLGVLPGPAPLEATVHRAFSDLRVAREWFAPKPPLVCFINDHAFGLDDPLIAGFLYRRADELRTSMTRLEYERYRDRVISAHADFGVKIEQIRMIDRLWHSDGMEHMQPVGEVLESANKMPS